MDKLTTPCKINLGLKIIAKRSDGYHTLDSLFYPLDYPNDLLEIELADPNSPNIQVNLNDSINLDPYNNSLTQAYNILAAKLPLNTLPQIKVTLHKGIPMGAGLGGGSSDGACLLNYLNNKLKNPLPKTTLNNLAQKVGADVPFFLTPKPTRVEGIGEQLTQVELDLSAYTLVLVTPKEPVNTAWAYKQYDNLKYQKNLRLSKSFLTDPKFSVNYFLPACAKGHFKTQKVSWTLNNDLEPGVLLARADLLLLKNTLLSFKPLECAMTGSGSSFYAFFPKGSKAKIGELEEKLATLEALMWIYDF